MIIMKKKETKNKFKKRKNWINLKWNKFTFEIKRVKGIVDEKRKYYNWNNL